MSSCRLRSYRDFFQVPAHVFQVKVGGGCLLKNDDLVDVAVPPAEGDDEWYEGALSGLTFVKNNFSQKEVILYAGVKSLFMHCVLSPPPKDKKRFGEQLQHENITPSSQWAVEHISVAEGGDLIHLANPLSYVRCNLLREGEQLVFRRSFTGVDKGVSRTEISQRFVQALDLHFLEEESAYCCLDEHGDIKPVIRLKDSGGSLNWRNVAIVTVDSEYLQRYMVVTGMIAVMKFDLTRVKMGDFSGWNNTERTNFSGKDIFYHSGKQKGASFVNGIIIARSSDTKRKMINRENGKFQGRGKKFVRLKAFDWRNNILAEISCSPRSIVSYFEKSSKLPFHTTPAFFRPEVLHRYKADHEKYTIEHRSITCRGGWSLDSYDINEAGQVHAYLHDISKLPYEEQLYWKSFNEWPKAPISKRAMQNDFEGKFSTAPDPLYDLKQAVTFLDESGIGWWKPRGEVAASMVHYPVTSSPEEWSNAILALDQLTVEGMIKKPLQDLLKRKGVSIDDAWGSLKLMEELISLTVHSRIDAKNALRPLKELHQLRNDVKGHFSESKRRDVVRSLRARHGSLAKHFWVLTSELKESLSYIVEKIK